MSVYLTSRWRGSDRRLFLPGRTTAGHYQIELDCNACHTPGMGVDEKSCLRCHAEELKQANDSHPKSKFTDPRNADLLKTIKADNCVTCHREHIPDQTRAMGVTMPDDYCYFCHQQTLKDVASHKDFKFDSCATAGCHNFHDNSALYKDFLLKHAREPNTKTPAKVPGRALLATLIEAGVMKQRAPLTSEQQDAPASVKHDDHLIRDWADTAHAKAGVNCNDCHLVEGEPHDSPPGFGLRQPSAAFEQDQTSQSGRGLPQSKTLSREARNKHWSDELDHGACVRCHREQVDGFLGGRHGMRLAQKLTPMTPALARLPMKPEATHRELGCASCHGAHDFDTRKAAVDACLGCHDDEHSRAYKDSKHFALWLDETSGAAPAGTGVSCATCHLPREIHSSGGETNVLVQHNQNLNLRPSEKMIRTVCLDCHGLAFSIDALADPKLARNNFKGMPSHHVESIDMALRRQRDNSKHN